MKQQILQKRVDELEAENAMLRNERAEAVDRLKRAANNEWAMVRRCIAEDSNDELRDHCSAKALAFAEAGYELGLYDYKEALRIYTEVDGDV